MGSALSKASLQDIAPTTNMRSVKYLWECQGEEGRRKGGENKMQQAYNIIIPLSLGGFFVSLSKEFKILQDPKPDLHTSFQKVVCMT